MGTVGLALGPEGPFRGPEGPAKRRGPGEGRAEGAGFEAAVQGGGPACPGGPLFVSRRRRAGGGISRLLFFETCATLSESAPGLPGA
ncbi:MAG: hypothetical protein LBO80_01765 [Treponema sp.]|nr:hypothetical protein [Treponema sp.]